MTLEQQIDAHLSAVADEARAQAAVQSAYDAHQRAMERRRVASKALADRLGERAVRHGERAVFVEGGTIKVLERWARRWRRGRFTILAGPVRGFADNFRSLLINPEVDADYACFCDQDDIWLKDKTEAAAATLAASGDRPALYCARTIIADEWGHEFGLSPLFRRPPNFANALVQSIGRATAEEVAGTGRVDEGLHLV